ncbi:MAG: glycosyl transferase, group 1, partial [Rhodospirillales bacterium]|nr:glycosyl transferase, group 1 [Rhodospirillales bacterium]
RGRCTLSLRGRDFPAVRHCSLWSGLCPRDAARRPTIFGADNTDAMEPSARPTPPCGRLTRVSIIASNHMGIIPKSPPRYAWVLSGRHAPTPAGGERGPRSEFEVFLERFGGQLLSCSTVDQPTSRVATIFKHLGRPRLSLANLVQSRTREFDAIIASGEDIGVPIALASLAGGARTPIHMMFHGHHLESPKLRLLAPVLRRMSHVHFHCLSESLRERTRAVLGIPAERCHATGYGVDTSYFGGGDMGNKAMIASAGAANRDYATLAAAVSDLPVEVRIAADSTWVPPVEEVGTSGWPGNVEARSYGTYARLRELYGRARFVVVPLHPATHACGYAVIAEAMAMGRAVIATRTASPPDFLISGTTGFFNEAHDIEGLRTNIRRLLENPVEAVEIGRRARAHILETHSLDRFCDRLERIVAASIGRQAPA